MKKPRLLIKKLVRKFRHSSLRFQLIFTFVISGAILILAVLFTTGILRFTINTVGKTYDTNKNLDNYLTQISEAEAAMESYMRYRTFESIDKYYNYVSVAEEMSGEFKNKPSAIPAYQKEYIIRRLSESFFYYSSNAIAAKRANKKNAIDENLAKSIQCYNFLRSEILNLNMMYFKANAQEYEINRNVTSGLMNLSVIGMFVVLVAAVFLLYLNLSSITQPLQKISSVALSVAERNFDVDLFNTDRHDEIGNICRAFDSMIISIREYVDTIWEKALKENELREKEIEMRALYADAQYKALQEQIHPHFLFNTLNTGAGLALKEGADQTCDFLEQVADFLRYSIQHPGRDVELKDELGMVDNYIYIMKTRFGSRYEFIKNIDTQVLGVRIPNMIIQPLVENCIKHGLKDVIENGKISITVVKEDGYVKVLISDNGCGFDPVIRKRILDAAVTGEAVIVNSSEIKENEHISTGLVNVISRLYFYYGRNDIFDILQNPDSSGTVFMVKIPDV